MTQFLHTLPFLPTDPQVWMTRENLADAVAVPVDNGVRLPSLLIAYDQGPKLNDFNVKLLNFDLTQA